MNRKKATRRVRSATKKRAVAKTRSAAKRSVRTVSAGPPARKRSVAKGRSVASKSGAATENVAARRATKQSSARQVTKKKAERPNLTLVKGKGGRATGAKSRHQAPDLRALPAALAADLDPGAAERGAQGSKQRVMLDLLRSRAQLMAVLDGIGADDAERPIAAGKWCTREIVLHLALRDRARLDEMESTQRGNPRSWMGFTVEDWKQQNALDLATVVHLDWAAALELLASTREELIEALEMVPDEPSEVWSEVHTFGSMLKGLPSHDAHHGEQVRLWRVQQGV